jgi:hypothetical protein
LSLGVEILLYRFKGTFKLEDPVGVTLKLCIGRKEIGVEVIPLLLHPL